MGIPTTVPYPFDVVIDGNGYVFADLNDEKASFGQSPVYVSRQNTQGDYGDNQQDFWLSWSQKDWSGGNGSRYQAHGNDAQNRYWLGDAINVTNPGEITLRPSRTAISLAANPTTAVADTINDRIYVATSTTLYHVIYDGTITSVGAHGLGAAPARFGSAADGRLFFLTTTAAGTVGVRSWNGASFSTFSATGADSLAFLNNTLYGYIVDSNKLIKYDSGGTASDVFLWRNASAAGSGYAVQAKLIPYGGKLLILRYRETGARGAELWVYDGSATSKLTEFPPNFNVYDCEILSGTVFISGSFEKHVSTTTYHRPAVYFYKDGQQDVLWQGSTYTPVSGTTAASALAVYDRGLVWNNPLTTEIYFYDAVNGGVTETCAGMAVAAGPIVVSANTFFLFGTTASTTANYFPSTAGTVTTGAVICSLADFDTSLRKVFRGIRVEFDSASDGDGGSVDIAYRYNDLSDTSFSGFTTLQTGAQTGAEYVISTPVEGTNYRSLAVKVTLNKGTSTDGPKLRRVLVRAVPVTTAFKRRKYVLLLGGRDGDSPVMLRDGSPHNLDGKEMAANLQLSASRSSPFLIIDHLSGTVSGGSGTGFTGVIEDLQMIEYKPEQWIATVSVRQV